MGKQTGCGVRAGKVKWRTPKVQQTEKKKKATGRAAKRNKLGKHKHSDQRNVNYNNQSVPTNVTRSVPTLDDLAQPSVRHTGASSWEMMAQMKGHSHHQEGGKQWARERHGDRESKREYLDAGDGTEDDYEEEEDYDEEEEEDEKYEEDEVSDVEENELTDLPYLQFGNNVTYPSTELGFSLIENFLDESEISQLLHEIDSESSLWDTDKEKRRVQIFGYNFLTPSRSPQPVPSYISPILEKLEKSGFGTFDQLLICEYLPGMGIRPHVDRFFWSDNVVAISLLSSCQLDLTNLHNSETHSYTVPHNSLYQLSGRSRYEYSHGISGKTVKDRRISLTFRKLAKENEVVVLPTTREWLVLN